MVESKTFVYINLLGQHVPIVGGYLPGSKSPALIDKGQPCQPSRFWLISMILCIDD